MSELVPTTPGTVALPAQLVDRAHHYATTSKASATLRAYRADWTDWVNWCNTQHLDPAATTGEHVATYLAWMADQGAALNTIIRRRTGLSIHYKTADLPNPCDTEPVRAVCQGIRRRLTRERIIVQADALTLDQLHRMVRACPPNMWGWRDKAMLLIGFAVAARRSELVAMTTDDIRVVPNGLEVRVFRQKTQRRQTLGVAPNDHDPDVCPVNRWVAWCDTRPHPTSDAAFPALGPTKTDTGAMSTQRVFAIMRARALQAGLPSRLITPHSLRAGAATHLIGLGVTQVEVMRRTDHTSLSVFAGYVRRAGVWDDPTVDPWGSTERTGR